MNATNHKKNIMDRPIGSNYCFPPTTTECRVSKRCHSIGIELRSLSIGIEFGVAHPKLCDALLLVGGCGLSSDKTTNLKDLSFAKNR